MYSGPKGSETQNLPPEKPPSLCEGVTNQQVKYHEIVKEPASQALQVASSIIYYQKQWEARVLLHLPSFILKVTVDRSPDVSHGSRLSKAHSTGSCPGFTSEKLRDHLSFL